MLLELRIVLSGKLRLADDIPRQATELVERIKRTYKVRLEVSK